MASAFDQLEIIGAKIQSQVAEFLSCREKLITLKGKGDFSLQNEVNALLRSQDQLEEELSSSLELIRQAKLGQWSSNLITVIPAFYYKMVQQIKNTGRVTKLSSGTSSAGPFPWLTVGIIAGLILLLRR